jgi:NADPH:quinone reductase
VRAIVVRAFGPPQVLEFRTRPDPLAGPAQLVLKVAAADILFLETMIRRGDAPAGMAPEPPYVPGNGVAGRVLAVGPGVAPSWIGRAAVARTGAGGGYAELAVVDLAELSAVPDGLALADAAALVHDGATALTLFDMTSAATAGTILVLGASGGLGLLLIQLAHRVGARVVATARDATKLDRIRVLAPTATVIDSDKPEWIEQARAALGEMAFDLVADGGHYSAHGTPSGKFTAIDPSEAARRHVTVTGIETVQLDTATRKLATDRGLSAALAGDLAPVIGQTYPLEQAADAHRAIEARSVFGKTLLTT